jgi:ADP-heptose:LPS heptosyltransferase
MLLLVRLLGMPSAFQATERAHQRVSATPRILLLRPDHLGDLVLTTPIVDALRAHAPDAHISMMVGPWSSEVVARHSALNRVLTCPFPGFQRTAQTPLAPYILLFRTAQQLRRGNYDLAINLRPDFWWGAALLYLAGIPRRVGYALAPGSAFLNTALPFPTAEHATVSNLRLISSGLQTLGYPALEEPYTPERYPLRFEPTIQEQTWVDERLQEAGIAANDSIVVIHAGTGAAVKLWRTEAWAYCANVLTTTFPPNLRIILTGSKHERPMLEAIAQGMAQTPLLITDATVGQLAAVLKRAQLVLGVDSGPLHLAVAQSTPTIEIFGPTDAHIFGPWGPAAQHRVIASTQRCPTCPAIPCGRLDFRPEELDDHPCVRLVSEQKMLDTIATLLHQLEKFDEII